MAQVFETAKDADFPTLARQLFGNVQLQFGDAPENSCRLSSACLGACRVSELEAGAHIVYGQRVVRASHDPDALKLLIQAEGCSAIEQGGQTVEFGDGAPVLYDPTRPYMLFNRTCVRLLLLQVPRNAFSRAAVQALAVPRLPPKAMAGLWYVLRSTIQASLAEAASLDAVNRASLGDMLVDLVRPIIEAREPFSQAGRSRSLDMLLERAKTYIAAHLEQSDLSLARIAAQMGCSPRYLFRAFEIEGMTPSQFLWDRRLVLARADLASPECARRSISDVAFSLGFSSSAHFSRAFRNRYDISPRDWRRAALGSVRP